MTTGYLWTGQFEECKLAVDEGRPQSMELDESTLDGHWSTNNKTGMDFFIINDAIFSKLCILGGDVEPCFEGSSVTAPQVSTAFTKIDNDFKQTLFSMMNDLKFALKGGENMEKELTDNTVEVTETVVEEVVTETPVVESDNSEQSSITENENTVEVVETFAKKDEDEKEDKTEDSKSDDKNKDKDDDKDSDSDSDNEDDKEKKTKHSLEAELEALQVAYSKLETEYNELVEFKNQVEDAKKDALIESFYMLSDEDKKDVIENKSKYSLDDIEAKLSIICVRNKVNFDLEDTSKNEEIVEEKENVTTYTIKNDDVTIPA